jgi:hypothetical protein
MAKQRLLRTRNYEPTIRQAGLSECEMKAESPDELRAGDDDD